MKPLPQPVRHVVGYLKRTYDGLIDISEFSKANEHSQAQAFRTRALTALALQYLTDCKPDEAANGVVDGFDDQGIDGIAVAPDGSHVWVVQTKWSDQGTASLDQAAALKLVRGIEKLQDGEYDDFGDKLQHLRTSVDAAMNTGGVRITIAICLLGKSKLAPVVEADLQKFLDRANDLVPTAELVVVDFDVVYETVKRGAADPQVDLSATLYDWGRLTEPFQGYYGTMSAGDIARWYGEAGDRLFDKNIRRWVGLTEVNQKIRGTLSSNPEFFWYLNNGITVLCESLDKTLKGSARGVGTFSMSGANVVNGAQTVRSIHDVAREHPDAVEDTRVWVRLISLQGCPPDFASLVTEATNTQNQVEARDFVSLDPTQAELRDDFALSLQKVYVIKRGEPDPPPDAGCSVLEVARALACAQPDAGFAARARQEGAVLWERGAQGTYSTLFGKSPGAERAWRLVTFMRSVSAALRSEERLREGRALRVASQAEFLITHVLLQHSARQQAPEPSPESWPALLDHVGHLVDKLVLTIDELYPGSSIPQVLRDADRCAALAPLLAVDLMIGGEVLELPLKYQAAAVRARRSRKPNAVTVLVDASALADGTPFEFRPRSAAEALAFDAWLTEDPRRGRATWINNRSRPLLWEADGRRYSPSGLAKDMLNAVGIATNAVQGTSYWYVKGGAGSLVDLADEIRSGELSGSD